jgi:hypothetical protein
MGHIVKFIKLQGYLLGKKIMVLNFKEKKLWGWPAKGVVWPLPDLPIGHPQA